MTAGVMSAQTPPARGAHRCSGMRCVETASSSADGTLSPNWNKIHDGTNTDLIRHQFQSYWNSQMLKMYKNGKIGKNPYLLKERIHFADIKCEFGQFGGDRIRIKRISHRIKQARDQVGCIALPSKYKNNTQKTWLIERPLQTCNQKNKNQMEKMHGATHTYLAACSVV